MSEGTFLQYLKEKLNGAIIEEDANQTLDEMFVIKSESGLPERDRIIELGDSFFLRGGITQNQRYSDMQGVALQYLDENCITSLTAVYIDNRIEVYIVNNRKENK
jgi:hypothetical protein